MSQIDRRRFLLTSAGAALATATPVLAQAGSEDAKLRVLLDRMFEQRVDDSPRFATALGLGSVVWFALLLNPLSAALAAAAILLYVVFYTLVLKRRTEQNIVWGGVAGCMPVLIGWAAVTGDLAWAPVVLFGIIFFWTPPHYWPLSMRFKQDYAAAGVPMMPVNHSDTYVGKRIVGYAAATVACTLALVPVAAMGWLYAVAALAAGAWFLWSCVGLLRAADGPAKEGRKRAMSVFHGSITYLSVVFLAVALDPFLHLPVL